MSVKSLVAIWVNSGEVPEFQEVYLDYKKCLLIHSTTSSLRFACACKAEMFVFQ